MKKIIFLHVIMLALLSSCGSTKNTGTLPTQSKPEDKKDFVWSGANIYFIVTDRFLNGNPQNDNIINRNKPTATLRGFQGGDIRGIIQKLDEGYFTKLGINAIWITPVVEQIHGCVDEGTGNTYGFHGYWTKDWTALDPSFGTRSDLKELVDKAHARGIRIVLDAVINHTGHATELDPKYPDDWVRSEPNCKYNSYDSNINCTLVPGLFDVKTESNEAVELPPMLVEKWKQEGRYEQEVAELNAFFAKTGYPRAPRYYIMKWLADYILDFGIDGYRADTVKHTYENVWRDFGKICDAAFAEYKSKNPSNVLDNAPFFTVGEVYGYGLHGKQFYDYGDKSVNYYQNGFGYLINFDFKGDANKTYEELFSYHNSILQNELKGHGVMNYISSHDDGWPFDKKREKPFESANKLLLAPGIAQVYYGDESARKLEVEGAQGDANLRSMMNWDAIQNDVKTQEILLHWQKLGQFRNNHPAVGAGVHKMVSASPYIFSREYTENGYNDKVLIALDLPKGKKELFVGAVFAVGDKVRDAYSGTITKVTNGKIVLDTPYDIVLIEKM